MIARFDKFSRFERPLFHLCNPGAKYVDGQLTNCLGILNDTSDEELELNFNAVSTLSFRLHKHEYEDAEQDAHFANLFDSMQNRRVLYLDDIGFFVITNVTYGYEDGETYKDIEASSAEIEMQDKKLPFIENGTYRFDEIFKMVTDTLPMWQTGRVDTAVLNKYRTFEDIDTDQNVLAFLLEDMQTAYECIFVFDITNRIVDVYDQHTYANETSIIITKSDLIDSVEIEESSDDLYTALSVFGDSDLSIAAVNPLGTITMYNFDHYLSWMPPALRDKVKAWQDLVRYYANVDGTTPDKDNYPKLGELYAEQYVAFIDADSEVEKINIHLEMYQRCYDNVAATGNSLVPSYNKYIEAADGEPIPEDIEDIVELQRVIKGMISDAKTALAAAEQDRTAKEAAADATWEKMMEVNRVVDITTYFTHDEYAELSSYISEGTYTDEYVTVTDDMDYKEQYEQLRTLYYRALDQLEKISQPTQEFSIDVENFLFEKDFSHMSEQLETGCIINVELEDGDIAPLFLTAITVNYEDLELSLTFGNRFCRFDPQAMFKDVLGNVKRSANSIEYMKEVLAPVRDGTLDRMKQALQDSRNLTKYNALTAENQDVLIDDSGYTGKRTVGPYGDADPEQIKIVNNLLVFTDDAWDTCKTAVGKIYFLDEHGRTYSKYGINAEVLLGDIILGSELHILYNDIEGNQVDAVEHFTKLDADINGVNIEVGKKVGADEIISKINLSPEEIKIIASKIALEGLTTINDKFIVNLDGSIEATDAKFSGDITGGTIGIGGSGGKNSNFYVDSNGNVTMKGSINLSGNITWPSTGAPVSRDGIYQAMLNNLTQDGLYSKDGYLCMNATAIKTGTLDANTVNVTGTLNTVNVKLAGSYGGFAQGQGSWRPSVDAADVTTYGVVMYGSNGLDSYGNARPPYFMVTDKGMRGQISSSNFWYMADSNFVIQGGLFMRQGGVSIRQGYGIYLGLYNSTTAPIVLRRDTNNQLELGGSAYNTIIYGNKISAFPSGDIQGFVGAKRLWYGTISSNNDSATFDDTTGFLFYVVMGYPGSSSSSMTTTVVPSNYAISDNKFQIADDTGFTSFTITSSKITKSGGSGRIHAVYGFR